MHSLLCLILMCLPVLLSFAPTPPPQAPRGPHFEKLVIAGEPFKLEVAADPATRERGLMWREQLDADRGMIFIYPTKQLLSFWMKNCLIDLDIIFLDDRGVILATHDMKAEPLRKKNESQSQYEARLERYPSNQPALFAIELKADSIRRLELEPGQKLELDVERLKKMAK